jgi:hypothetical protein
MNATSTISDLENQEPPFQEDLEKELGVIAHDLGSVRIMLRMGRVEEKTLMDRRNWLRLQLQLLREPAHITLPAEVAPIPNGRFNGTTQPECPDCTMDDA